MKTLKYFPLLLILFATTAFSYDKKTEWRAKQLETSSWHIVDMVANRVGDARLTSDTRRLARAASVLKFSARRGDFQNVIDRDFHQIESLYNHVFSSFKNAHYAHHRLHEQSDFRALQGKFFALRASVRGVPYPPQHQAPHGHTHGNQHGQKHGGGHHGQAVAH